MLKIGDMAESFLLNVRFIVRLRTLFPIRQLRKYDNVNTCVDCVFFYDTNTGAVKLIAPLIAAAERHNCIAPFSHG